MDSGLPTHQDKKATEKSTEHPEAAAAFSQAENHTAHQKNQAKIKSIRDSESNTKTTSTSARPDTRQIHSVFHTNQSQATSPLEPARTNSLALTLGTAAAILLVSFLLFAGYRAVIGSKILESNSSSQQKTTASNDDGADEVSIEYGESSKDGTVGTPMEVNSLAVTIESITQAPASDFDLEPLPGYTYYNAKISIQNLTDTARSLSDGDFQLKTQDGTTLYQASVRPKVDKLLPDSIEPNSSIEGIIVFEVPESEKLDSINFVWLPLSDNFDSRPIQYTLRYKL